MGQATGVGADEALETVITNALVLDYTGIYKADVGMKKGLISGLGKAGNPDVMEVRWVRDGLLFSDSLPRVRFLNLAQRGPSSSPRSPRLAVEAGVD